MIDASGTAVIAAQAGIQFVGLTALKINQMNKLDSDIRRNDSPRRADEPAAFCRRYPTYAQPSAETGSDHGFRMIAGQRSAQDG